MTDSPARTYAERLAASSPLPAVPAGAGIAVHLISTPAPPRELTS
ncbi:hypothetical protein [Streptomyces sp. ITFR-6]|nr:hypothetical protein [Streptomyces sp. ITFR-6]WNI31494.1 hypothetical protein RLT59_23895 [Streptomyces sp. ITFR-6]